MNSPDFFLASSEGYGMEKPFRCFAIKRLKGEKRDDYLLVRIEPPLIGQRFGLGGHDIDYVILATRHQGDSLFPVSRWPAFVHVARLLIPYDGREIIMSDQMESIAWAELYPTLKEAHAQRCQ